MVCGELLGVGEKKGGLSSHIVQLHQSWLQEGQATEENPFSRVSGVQNMVSCHIHNESRVHLGVFVTCVKALIYPHRVCGQSGD
jgi:hypothetical protein